MHHVILNHYGDEFVVSSVHAISKRNTQEGTETHSMQLCDCDITVTCFYLGLKCTCSVLGTAQLLHRFGSISFTLT